MRTIGVLIRKEFIQIRRNRIMIPAMIIAPLIQMFILVYAANLNMRDIDFAVYDENGSSSSMKLTEKYLASPFFSFAGAVHDEKAAMDLLRRDQADIIIRIPFDFESRISRGEKSSVQFLVNGINSAAAVLTSAYAQNVLMDFNREIIPVFSRISQGASMGSIELTFSHWYNPELDFKIFMVPGILVILVTLVGWLLMSLNVVREKELGTTEQINVTPIKKYQFIIGKLIPFWILAMVELGIGLLMGRLIFNVPMLGSLGLLFGFVAIYLVTVLGFGLFFAAISETQQQVMFLNFFFYVVFILMSGLFTPVESMPAWAHWANTINPLSYFMRVIRMILLKGSDFSQVWQEFAKMGVFGVVMISLAVRSYRKRV